MPVDVKDGISLQEDHIVPVDEEEAVVHIEGTALTIQSSLKALRAGYALFTLDRKLSVLNLSLHLHRIIFCGDFNRADVKFPDLWSRLLERFPIQDAAITTNWTVRLQEHGRSCCGCDSCSGPSKPC